MSGYRFGNTAGIIRYECIKILRVTEIPLIKRITSAGPDGAHLLSQLLRKLKQADHKLEASPWNL